MKTFLNLTNGLLWQGEFDGFIRIQSCHCEQKLWTKIIQEVDNNFLMWLALGKDIQVVDYSARKDVPRSLYQGLEWVWFVCCKVWNLPMEKAMVRNNDCTAYFEEQYKKLDKSTIKKISYFNKFIKHPKKPQIVCSRTNMDGNYEHFSLLAKTL